MDGLRLTEAARKMPTAVGPAAGTAHQSLRSVRCRDHTVTNHAFPASTSSYMAPCFECLVQGPADVGGCTLTPTRSLAMQSVAERPAIAARDALCHNLGPSC